MDDEDSVDSSASGPAAESGSSRGDGDGGGGGEPSWRDYAQAFSDVIEALERVDHFMQAQHFTTLDLFRVCDVNGSGSLSKDELVDNFLRVGLPITYGQARHLVDFLDGNHSDEIEYPELDDALKHYRRLKRMCGGHGQQYWIRRYLQRNPAESRDPCFPNSWVNREDFKVAFPRFQERPRDPEAEVVAVQEVLFKRKEDREHADLHRVLAFLETVPALRRLGTRKLWDLGQRLGFMSVRPDDLILKQATKGRLFYILVSGSVAVQYNRLQMAVLTRGDVFGDKSLREAPTDTPTYVALEFTKLATLSSEDYYQVLHEHFSNQNLEMKRWLQEKVPLLAGLKKLVVVDVAPYLVSMTVPKGYELFVQGASSVSLFFVRKGKVEIRSTYMVPKVNRLPMSTDRSVFQEIRKRSRLEKAYGVIGEGACFGEDCIMGFHNRQYTAVVVSDDGATLYQLRRHQAARAFMRHKDRFAQAISSVHPYLTVPSEERFLQTLAVTEEARIKQAAKEEATGPHYQKRVAEAMLKLPKLVRPRHHGANKRGIRGNKVGIETLRSTLQGTTSGLLGAFAGSTRLPDLAALQAMKNTLGKGLPP